MNTSDLSTLKELRQKVGRTFHYTLEDERCVELNLTSDEYLYQGLIRHHSAAEKMDVLKLVSRLTGLKTLNLRRNKLFQLPPEFSNLRELEQLNLGSNYLGGVPVEISGFSRLKYLHLGNNDIAELPAFIGEFQNLEYLTLHKNLKLKSVQALASLHSLKALNLYFLNLGGRLPSFIYGFKKLVTLTLWNIKDLSDELTELQNLIENEDWGDHRSAMIRFAVNLVQGKVIYCMRNIF